MRARRQHIKVPRQVKESMLPSRYSHMSRNRQFAPSSTAFNRDFLLGPTLFSQPLRLLRFLVLNTRVMKDSMCF